MLSKFRHLEIEAVFRDFIHCSAMWCFFFLDIVSLIANGASPDSASQSCRNVGLHYHTWQLGALNLKSVALKMIIIGQGIGLSGTESACQLQGHKFDSCTKRKKKISNNS